jgi:hypothetical protein
MSHTAFLTRDTWQDNKLCGKRKQAGGAYDSDSTCCQKSVIASASSVIPNEIEPRVQ